MKLRFVAITTFLALMSGAAVAADVYPEPANIDWSGFYIGANGGYGWADTSNFKFVNTTHEAGVVESGVDTKGTLEGLSADGVFGGVQVGYNYQVDNIVLGVEGDFQGTDVSSSRSKSSSFDTAIGEITNSWDQSIDWFGTLRARVGYLATDNLLLYVTGGVALAGLEQNFHAKWQYTPESAETDTLSNNDSQWGYTLGAGAEYALTQDWSMKLEYQYLDFGSVSLNETEAVKAVPGYVVDVKSNDINVRMQSVRVGFNYHF